MSTVSTVSCFLIVAFYTFTRTVHTRRKVVLHSWWFTHSHYSIFPDWSCPSRHFVFGDVESRASEKPVLSTKDGPARLLPRRTDSRQRPQAGPSADSVLAVLMTNLKRQTHEICHSFLLSLLFLLYKSAGCKWGGANRILNWSKDKIVELFSVYRTYTWKTLCFITQLKFLKKYRSWDFLQSLKSTKS